MGKKIKVGIAGCGFIGGALKNWLENNNNNCEILIYDPPKGIINDLSSCNVIFISIHIPTQDDGTQDLSILEAIIESLPNVPIYIRTTVLPGTCDMLSEKYKKEIYFMPEFLTQRTAQTDFDRQTMVFTGKISLLKDIFIGKKYIEMTSLEAEISKYAHNVFGALKVTYFNGIYDLCKKNNCDFNRVLESVLLSGYINDCHTNVPGPDGKTGYGGKCFPKDVKAFCKFTQNYPLNELIKTLESLNDYFRNNQGAEKNAV